VAPAGTNEAGPVPSALAGGRSRPAVRAAGAVVAAFTAIALGTIAMFGFAAGNHRWDGPVMIQVIGSHGIHYVDVLGLEPFGAGVLLAVWCLHRPAERAERADDPTQP
jgi:hypothetical protein